MESLIPPWKPRPRLEAPVWGAPSINQVSTYECQCPWPEGSKPQAGPAMEHKGYLFFEVLTPYPFETIIVRAVARTVEEAELGAWRRWQYQLACKHDLVCGSYRDVNSGRKCGKCGYFIYGEDVRLRMRESYRNQHARMRKVMQDGNG